MTGLPSSGTRVTRSGLLRSAGTPPSNQKASTRLSQPSRVRRTLVGRELTPHWPPGADSAACRGPTAIIAGCDLVSGLELLSSWFPLGDTGVRTSASPPGRADRRRHDSLSGLSPQPRADFL